MTDILITAFEPFGGDEINPTELILHGLPDGINGVRLSKLLLPVEFAAAGDIAVRTMLGLKPGAVIMLGQAGGRDSVTPERVAINVMDARIPDNAGFMPQDEPVVPGGPAAYFSALPIKSIVQSISALGIPAGVSNTAGTYVCNALMYRVLHAISLKGLKTKAGFIHFPFIPQQVKGVAGRENEPFIELSSACRAALAAADALSVVKDL